MKFKRTSSEILTGTYWYFFACSWCPSTLVVSKLYIPLVGCYRQLLGSAFMKARSGSILPRKDHTFNNVVICINAEHVNKPALGVFLRAIDQPDIMDALHVRLLLQDNPAISMLYVV